MTSENEEPRRKNGAWGTRQQREEKTPTEAERATRSAHPQNRRVGHPAEGKVKTRTLKNEGCGTPEEKPAQHAAPLQRKRDEGHAEKTGTAMPATAGEPCPYRRQEAHEIRRLRREELPTETVELARWLIGKVVVHELPEGRVSGRIVEDEAYPPGDPAGHHFRGPTPRIRPMYLARGHSYVYFNYGNHFMLNVVSEAEGTAAAILIRGLEPLGGVALMQKNRGTERLVDLTRGPGRLAAAMRITREHDGLDLTADGPLWLGELASPNGENGSKGRAATIGTTVRIGITRAADRPLRFYEQGSPFVSGPKHLLLRPVVKSGSSSGAEESV